jgi:putative lysine/arginine/ornithine/histidine/octopine transport system substrate-binding protein
MKVFRLVAALALGLALAVPAIAAEKLRIGTEGAYPPFNQIDARGRVFGFDIDIARALCREMGMECEFVTQDWDGIIPGLLARKYDAIVASMSITEERQRAVAFTNPYYTNKLRFVARDGAYADPRQVDGLIIGAQRATIAAQWLEDNLAHRVDIRLYDTQENAFLDLATGRVNAVLSDFLPAYNWLATKDGEGFTLAGNEVDIDDKIGIAVRKEDTALRDRLNAALAAIVANGTYAEINKKYFPFSIY